MNTCTKCGQPVPPKNDALILDQIFVQLTGITKHTLHHSRHLFPIVNETGEVICQGSASRVQYILKGGTRDPRSTVHYNPAHEIPTREAYRRMREERH